MKLFLSNIAKFLSIAVIAIIVLLINYLYLDPFKVIKTYDDYSNSFVAPNRDYVSTEMFKKNYKKYNYNSFIFGSSRTIAYKPESWSNYLPKNSSPFSFDASGESIYGIYTKFKYLDSLGVNIQNALIIICRDHSFASDVNYNSHIAIKHPEISRESIFKFHLTFFKDYLNPKFLFYYYNYILTKEYKPFMADYIENRVITYDTITNETNIIDQEYELRQDPLAYYAKRKDNFYERKRETSDTIERVNKKKYLMLKYIKQILEKSNSNYKVVVSPLYEQTKLNSIDKIKLDQLFGRNLYDFSGKNAFTDSITNYYESSHYRPSVGDSILKIMYTKI